MKLKVNKLQKQRTVYGSVERQVMDLSEKEIKLIEATATAVAKKFKKDHICRFDEETAKTIHNLHDVAISENADAGTFRIIFQWGRTAQDATKTIRRIVVFGILTALLIVFGPHLVSNIGAWITRLHH